MAETNQWTGLFCTSLPVRTRGQHHRSFGQSALRRAENESSGDGNKKPNPVLEEYLRKHPDAPATQQQQLQSGGRGVQGDLGASSIFEDERRAQEQAEREAADDKDSGLEEIGGQQRDPRRMQQVLDPDPNSRERWERKKVIQMIRKGGRLTKTQFVKRTEREHLVRSYNMKTSVKKLGMLARQIAGKNIDDAITQMRFSKKKVAGEVLKQLEMARDEAIVMRGMGLGNVENAEQALDTSTSLATAISTRSSAAAEKESEKPVEIQLKDGKRHLVTDRSKVYIDQAWVGRGPYGQLPDYRARGRVFIMRTPWTSISVVLKEEATRVREYEEREEKRRRQRMEKVWVPLPDRPIQQKMQWYSW